MTEREFVRYVLRLKRSTRSPDLMRRNLRGAGFKHIGKGVFKHVYAHPDHPYVVKVRYGHEYGAEVGEAQKFYYLLPRRAKKHFLALLYEDKLIQIQPKVVPCGRYNCWASFYWDGHRQNHTHINGRKVVFDYAFQGDGDTNHKYLTGFYPMRLPRGRESTYAT